MLSIMPRHLWENCMQVAGDAVKRFKPAPLILQAEGWGEIGQFLLVKNNCSWTMSLNNQLSNIVTNSPVGFKYLHIGLCCVLKIHLTSNWDNVLLKQKLKITWYKFWIFLVSSGPYRYKYISKRWTQKNKIYEEVYINFI